jgi:hypothetical protein
MNWGYKILTAYAIFVAGMAFLLIKSSGQNQELVTEDYYAQELKYQQKIDEANRTNALSEAMEYKIKEDTLSIDFPKDFKGLKIKGTVFLYCPSNQKHDKHMEFETDLEKLELNIAGIAKGLYQLQIGWVVNGQHYYYENKITI